MKKKPFWLTPYPELIVSAFKKLLPEQKEKKERSPRGIRRLLAVLAVIALVLIWVVEGFVNPLEYLVDMPALSLLETVDAYPEPYGGFYYMLLLGVTAIMMTALKYFICGERDLPFWTLNGILYWIVGLAVAVLADALTRNIIMNRLVLPSVMGMNDSTEAIAPSVLTLILVHFLIYFAIEDFSGNGMAVLLTPYAIAAYDKFVAPVGFLDVQLVKLIILTLVLKLFLLVLDKLGITKLLSKLLINVGYVLIPGLLFVGITFPILPYIIIFWLAYRNWKQKKEQKV